MVAAIEVNGLSKHFRRYHPDRPNTLQEAVLRGLRGMGTEGEFWALQDVNFRVDRGSMVGIIGQNGAGKSTLLRVVGGVMKPDSGSVSIKGRLGALIDLGAGFHPDLNGRENLYINGIISGLTRNDVDKQFESIVEFAELGEFIDNPLRTYSTGMQMRLAFAVATHTHPEVLLIDEILSVGDLAFQRKCLERISWFQSEGCAVMVVSHDTVLISKMCDEAIWLSDGRVVAHGPPEMVTQKYALEMRSATENRTPTLGKIKSTKYGTNLQLKKNRFGSLEMQITEVGLLSKDGITANELESGDSLRITIKFHAPNSIVSPIFSVTISRDDGSICFDSNTGIEGYSIPDLSGTGEVTLKCDRLDLVGGQYFVDVGIYRNDWAYAYDYHWHAYPLIVKDNPGRMGILRPPISWEIVV